MILDARRSGATSTPVRAFALVLAALATGLPLLLMMLGLSIRTIETMRDPPLAFDLIPEPPPPSPPEPRPQPPSPAKPAERAAAPAPAAPRPATLVDQSATLLPQPAPQPRAADFSGAGTTTTPGVGSGTGGDGPGGNGSASAGGTARPAERKTLPVRTAASWVYKPGVEELRSYNPPMATTENVTGQVLLSCRVLRNRKVKDCRVVADRPRGYGFGLAALEVARLFRLKPPTIDGVPDEEQRVEIPVTFNSRR